MSVLEQLQRITGTGEDVLVKDFDCYMFVGSDHELAPDLVVARRRTIVKSLGAGIAQHLTLDHLTEDVIATTKTEWPGQVSNSLEISWPSTAEVGTGAGNAKRTSVSIVIAAHKGCLIPAIEWSGPRDLAVESTDAEFWKQWGVHKLRRTDASVTANILPNFEELVRLRLSEIE